MTTKDLSLLLTVLATEEAAIKRIYHNRLKSIASRYDSDDLFADVQFQALRNWDSCTSTDLDGVRKWLRVIAKNTTVTMLERHLGCKKRSIRKECSGSREATFNQIENCATYEDDDQVELEELLQKCRKAVDELPTRQAKAVIRRYLDDVDYDIIAAEMKVSVGAARTLASRGIVSCREQVGEYLESTKERLGNDQTSHREKVQRC